MPPSSFKLSLWLGSFSVDEVGEEVALSGGPGLGSEGCYSATIESNLGNDLRLE